MHSAVIVCALLPTVVCSPRNLLSHSHWSPFLSKPLGPFHHLASEVINQFPLWNTFTFLLWVFLKFFILFLGRREKREKERERNLHAWEKPIGCLLHIPHLGTRPATQACALTGIEPATFLFAGWQISKLSHTRSGLWVLLKPPPTLRAGAPLYCVQLKGKDT